MDSIVICFIVEKLDVYNYLKLKVIEGIDWFFFMLFFCEIK